jgi:hypothetical protein
MRDMWASCSNARHIVGRRRHEDCRMSCNSDAFEAIRHVRRWHMDCFKLRQSMTTAVFRIANASVG